MMKNRKASWFEELSTARMKRHGSIWRLEMDSRLNNDMKLRPTENCLCRDKTKIVKIKTKKEEKLKSNLE